MSTDKYRHLAFQIDQFYKTNGYIDVADLITYLQDDIESIKTIGEISSLNLSNEINEEELDDYFDNIREYNEKEQTKLYKDKLKKEVDFSKKIELANKALEIKRRRIEHGRRD